MKIFIVSWCFYLEMFHDLRLHALSNFKVVGWLFFFLDRFKNMFHAPSKLEFKGKI